MAHLVTITEYSAVLAGEEGRGACLPECKPVGRVLASQERLGSDRGNNS